MRRNAVLVTVVAALAAYAQEAEALTLPCTAASPCTFTTVDDVAVLGRSIVVKGILQGEATPTERSLELDSSTTYLPNIDTLASCQRLALMAMARPSQFVLRLDEAYQANLGYVGRCRLSRVSL